MSTLESEDLENVQLVRMEDVQPSRERPCEVVGAGLVKEEDLETCIVDNLDYDNECVVVGNEDSNIGSMVSIQSEEVVEESSAELIVPEIVAPMKVVVADIIPPKPKKTIGPESWPTLEILPGGVINHLEKYEDDLTSLCSATDNEAEEESGEMMYACAKCPERFQYLCSLVKHVRWHALEQRKRNEPDLLTLCSRSHTTTPVLKKNYVCLKPTKTITKTCKKKVVKILPKKPKS